VARLAPGELECRLVEHAKGRARGVVHDDAASGPPDNDHIVETSGPILQQDDDRGAGAQVILDDPGIAANRLSSPSAGSKRSQQRLAADPAGGLIDQVGECFRIDVGRAPIPHDHSHGGAAAEQFTLGKIRNVE
jgi:hypothetical protein